ncbi:MAG: hypothetical protein R3225_05100, partial [Halofilum sp. (in: g-proteobacteria)]|nr:hypothetical protein [Halofilum sp. (in: g-proteobacteria)]
LLVRMDKLDDEQRFADWSALLLEQAVLAEGGQLEDPAAFVQRMNTLLSEWPQSQAAADAQPERAEEDTANQRE